MKTIKKYILMLLCLFFVQQHLFAQEPSLEMALAEDEIEDNFYESLKQRAIENYDKAVNAIQKCILKEDKNPVFYHELGKNLLDLKKYVEAEEAFKRAIELDPKQRWYWNGLYDVYYKSKDYQKSIPVVQKLIEFDKNMREDLVSLYMYTNQRDKALDLIKEMESETVLTKTMEFYKLRILETVNHAKPQKEKLEQAIEENPKIEQNYIDLILLYSNDNQEEKAFEIAKKLADEIPTSDWAQVSLFKFYLLDSKGEEASQSLFKVFENDIIDVKIKQRMLNEFLIYVANTNTLEEELLKAVDLIEEQASINVPTEIGKFFYNRKKYSNAAFYLKKGINKDREDLATVVLLFSSYDLMGDYDSLKVEAEEYVELYPAQAEFYYYAALANFKVKNQKTAIDYLETGQEFIIENPKLEKEFFFLFSEIYKLKGDVKKQQFYLNKAK